MLITQIPPFDDGCVRLGRAAELIARERDDATVDDIIDCLQACDLRGRIGP